MDGEKESPAKTSCPSDTRAAVSGIIAGNAGVGRGSTRAETQSRYRPPYGGPIGSNDMVSALQYIEVLVTDRDNAVRAVHSLELDNFLKDETIQDLSDRYNRLHDDLRKLGEERDQIAGNHLECIKVIDNRNAEIQMLRGKLAKARKPKKGR